jgi:hypothetical protein
MRDTILLPLVIGRLLSGCATGPSVMVLPGTRKNFEQTARHEGLRGVAAHGADSTQPA